MPHYLRNAKVLALVGLLAVGIIVGVAHNKARDHGASFLPEDAVRVVMKPFQVLVSRTSGLFEGLARSLRSRSAVQSENERLRTEVRQLNAEVMRLREQAAEAGRLRAMLGLKEQSSEALLAARMISRDPSEWFATGTIDRGRSSGIRPGQAAITQRGLVGQIFEASPTTSQVQGITDHESGIGAMVQRSRAVGICKGQDSDLLHLTYLAKDADITPGDIIITSGQGGVLPKGIPVGRVVKVQMESGGFMKSAEVRPSVRFDQVEEVFVVLRGVG